MSDNEELSVNSSDFSEATVTFSPQPRRPLLPGTLPELPLESKVEWWKKDKSKSVVTVTGYRILRVTRKTPRAVPQNQAYSRNPPEAPQHHGGKRMRLQQRQTYEGEAPQGDPQEDVGGSWN